MARAAPIQTNFTAGELSPLLYGRIDLAKYANGAKQIVNAIVQPHGGATRRPGTRFVAKAKYSDRPLRLVPFRFNAGQAYVLEFGDGYIRFYKDEGRIETPSIANVISNGDFTSGISGWVDKSTGGGAISHDATNNRLSLDTTASAHISFAEQQVTGDLSGSALVRFEVFGQPGDTVVATFGALGSPVVIRTVGVGKHIVAVPSSEGPPTGDFYIGFMAKGTARPTPVSIDDVAVVTGPVEIVSPYAVTDLAALKIAQSADTLYIAHPDYPPMRLLRFAHDEWSLEEVTFLDGPYLDENTSVATLTPSHTNGYHRTLTASDDLFALSDIGRTVRLKHGATWGWGVIHQFNSATSVGIHVISDFGGTGATAAWRFGAWSQTTGWPACVSFHEQRLCWAGERSNPQAFRASKSGDFQNMAPTATDGAVNDDHALNYVIGANQVNAIRWLSTTRSLVLGTTGGAWPVRANSLDDPLTPANIQIKRASTFGSADIQPLDVGDVVLYVSPAGRKLRELAFLFERDNFAAPDLSILSEHITAGGIVQMDYAQEPSGVVFAVRTDGVLLGMTYEREQNVVAWQRHILGGAYAGGAPRIESIAVVPSTLNGDGQVWLVATRTINGATVRCIEFIAPQLDAGSDPEDSYFVDCGLSYDDPKPIIASTSTNPVVVTAASHGFVNGDAVDLTGLTGIVELNNRRFSAANVTSNTFELSGEDGTGYSPFLGGGFARKAVSEITGLDHLDGENVDLLADGIVVASQTVVNGSIGLSSAASRIHAGYAYETDLETLNLEAGATDGTAQGKTKRIDHLVLRVYRTAGIRVGPESDFLEAVDFGAPGVVANASALFSGDIEVAFGSGYETDSTVLIRQDQPLPMTILAVMPRVDTAAR